MIIRGPNYGELPPGDSGDEWDDWLPPIENAANAMKCIMPLGEDLISGVVRKGHKMLLTGPSKAGKSFTLIELCICLAEGAPWMGFTCAHSRVLYINLELDRASCLHRFHTVYDALELSQTHLTDIFVWNLRGCSKPLDQLTPAIISRCKRLLIDVLVIDPIYKVGMGDENSAQRIAAFCNQLDKICTETGCTVIYCHHHSKGDQGWKASADRGAGSGVFARDADAILDLIELELPQEKRADSTAWRLTGTLREYASFAPVDVWFNFPLHIVERFGALDDTAPHSQLQPYQRAMNARKTVSVKSVSVCSSRSQYAKISPKCQRLT